MVTQAEPALKTLSAIERTAVLDFLARVQYVYGKRIQRAMLFGSKARGEAAADSDIDLLLIVADETPTIAPKVGRSWRATLSKTK